MGHLQLISSELQALLSEAGMNDKTHTDAICRWVQDRVLESYRNGLKAPKSRKPKEKGE